MTVSLRSARARQPTDRRVHNVLETTEDAFDHNLDVESVLSFRSTNSDNSFSDSSMSSKLSAANAQYPTELSTVGIYPAQSTNQQPLNLSEVVQYLTRERDDVSRDPTDLAEYRDSISQVGNEDELILFVIPKVINIDKPFRSDKYSFVCNRSWTFQVVFSEQLGHPQPDFTFGLAFDKLSRQYPRVFNQHGELARFLQPLKGTVLPLVFIEAKGPKGALSEAVLQNRNNGANALRDFMEFKREAANVLQKLLSVKGEPAAVAAAYNRMILPISIEFTAESVQATCHWIQEVRGQLRYWSISPQPPINTHSLSGAQKLCRNVFDWAEARYDEAIKEFALLEKNYASLEKYYAKENRKRARSPTEENEATMESRAKKRRRRRV